MTIYSCYILVSMQWGIITNTIEITDMCELYFRKGAILFRVLIVCGQGSK